MHVFVYGYADYSDSQILGHIIRTLLVVLLYASLGEKVLQMLSRKTRIHSAFLACA